MNNESNEESSIGKLGDVPPLKSDASGEGNAECDDDNPEKRTGETPIVPEHLLVENPGDQQAARMIINSLLAKGIRLIAFDFDQTIVTCHTAGRWRSPSSDLAEFVRPCFKLLLQYALESPLHVCIVTYSSQPVLIRDVIQMVLPKSSNLRKLLVRANTSDWNPAASSGSIVDRLCAMSYGKQEHIAWIVTELYKKCHAIIEPQEILLIDDDEENVQIALDFGHQAFEVKEDVTLDAINKYVDNLVIHKRSEEMSPQA